MDTPLWVPRAEDSWRSPLEADFSNLEAVGHALANAAPSSQPCLPLRVLGTGYYSVAVETPSGCVFLLALAREVGERHQRVAQLLPWVAGQLPDPVPVPQWTIPPGSAFPYGALGYRKLTGQPLTAELFDHLDHRQLAQDLAGFIYRLHEVSPSEAQRYGAAPPDQVDRELRQISADLLAILATRVTPQFHDRVATWWAELFADPQMREFEPVLTHGDLGNTNLLVDSMSGHLRGVLDWEFAAVGDPAVDFQQLGDPGTPLQDAVLDAYVALGGRISGDAHYRLHRYWQMGPTWGIRMAERRRDESLVVQHIERLRRQLQFDR
ncbi:MAG: hypothetical protein QOF51_2915 [Chloroflexota bacterium]|nr:hypothetical protein [Chloroflexota bacterium]